MAGLPQRKTWVSAAVGLNPQAFSSAPPVQSDWTWPVAPPQGVGSSAGRLTMGRKANSGMSRCMVRSSAE